MATDADVDRDDFQDKSIQDPPYAAFCQTNRKIQREIRNEETFGDLDGLCRQGSSGEGIASELVRFAKKVSDKKGIPLLFDTDMKDYAEMYQHLGCELYNTVTADNGVTRYSLCYHR